MANVTIVTAANWVPEIWSTIVFEVLHTNLVLAPLVDHKYDALAKGPGDRIHVPNFAEFSATKETRSQPAAGTEWSEGGGAITFSANTENQTTIEIDVRAYVAVLVDDPVGMQDNLPEMQMFTTEMGRALAQQVDTDVGTNLATATAVNGVDNVAVGEVDITDSRITLDDANVDMAGRKLAISPSTHMDLLQVDRYANSLYAGSVGNLNGAKGRGFLGNIQEFDVYGSTNLPAGTSGTKNLMFQTEGTALVMQQDVVVTKRSPHDQFAEAVRAVTFYGLKLMRDAAVVRILGR